MLVDETFNGRTVEVMLGQTIEVLLNENPTTGFRWQLTSDGSPACAIIDDQFKPLVRPPGGGGQHLWRFSVLRPAEGDIELRYVRHWEVAKEATRTFRIHIQVKS